MKHFEFSCIPKGSFKRSDGRTIDINSFSISKYELTKELWDTVRNKSINLGYDLTVGRGVSKRRAIACITWYDAVKLCNALSEMMRMKPVYYVDNDHQTVYRNGEVELGNKNVDWAANGFRLPTEAEWEYACRAGTTTKYYWGEYTSAGPKNSYARHFTSEYNMCVPRDVGTLLPNAFDLYDMSGNVFEWCWDIYDEYSDQINNPKGSKNGIWRVLRGGSVALDSPVDSSFRAYTRPDYSMYDTGLRLASSNLNINSIYNLFVEENSDTTSQTTSYVTEIDKTIKKLYGLLDIHRNDLKEFKDATEAGDAQSAAKAFAEAVIRHFESLDLSVQFAFQTKEEYKHLKEHKGKVKWFGPDAQISLFMESPKWYIKWYKETGDAEYIRKWFEVADDFAQNYKAEFDHLSDEYMLLIKEVPVSWTWGSGYCIQRRTQALLSSLAEIINNCGEAGEVISADTICRVLISVATDHLNDIIKDNRKCVPNQYVDNAATLMLCAVALPWFKDAPWWMELGKNRIFDAVFNSTMLSDGGDLEQSFNYNAGMPNLIFEVSHLLGQYIPEWFNKLFEAALLRIRLLRALTQPIGGVPGIGSAATNYPPLLNKPNDQSSAFRKFMYDKEQFSLKKYPCKAWEQIVEKMWGDESDAKQSFTSIAFPYSGYYIMRDGWSNKSLYMWFDAARKGRGHVCENINSVSVCGYGRHLICEPGALSYGNKGFVPEDQHHLMEGIDKYNNSSLSRNTISVDGYSQNRYFEGENTGVTPYNDIIKNKWYSSQHIDFVEGIYSDGYGNKEISIEAEHHRKIIFLKELGIWIIVDSMKSNTAHVYKQVWAFPPEYFEWDDFEGHKWQHQGFADNEVIIDWQEQRIFTADLDGGNVYIYTIGENIAYERYFGCTEPYAGWMSPRILSRRVPKTDVHVNWQGENSSIITVIAPTPNNKERIINMVKGTNGFTAELGESKIHFEYCENTKQMKHNDVVAECNLLLTVEKDGTEYGAVLGCSNFQYNSTVIDLKGDFEFVVDKNCVSGKPIEIPDKFLWKEDVNGIMPYYSYLMEEK